MISMHVCLSVCLCLCVSISRELHVKSSPRFLHVTCGRGLVLLRTFALPGQSPPMLPLAVACSCSGHSPPGSRTPDTRP